METNHWHYLIKVHLSYFPLQRKHQLAGFACQTETTKVHRSHQFRYTESVSEHEVSESPEGVQNVSVVPDSVSQPMGGKTGHVWRLYVLLGRLQLTIPVGNASRVWMQALNVPEKNYIRKHLIGYTISYTVTYEKYLLAWAGLEMLSKFFWTQPIFR